MKIVLFLGFLDIQPVLDLDGLDFDKRTETIKWTEKFKLITK